MSVPILMNLPSCQEGCRHRWMKCPQADKSSSRSNMSFDAIHENDNTDKIFVYFCADKNVSKASMKTYASLRLGEVTHGLTAMR